MQTTQHVSDIELIKEQQKDAGEMSDLSNSNADLILRRAGRHHFAFLKGHLEGLDIRRLAWRYLETADTEEIDLRVVYSTLKWIRHELRALAKRHGKFAYARVIAINPVQLPVANRAVPTLEEFREERDAYDLYSEADLLELFHAEYGDTASDAKSRRNVRLRARQAEALAWFEARVTAAPTMSDGVDGWLKPTLSNRLIRAGITTIRDLIELINTRGHGWYRVIPYIGGKHASRIMKWLRLNTDVLSVRFGQHALVRRCELDVDKMAADRKREFGIVPIEFFKPRLEMDGSRGVNRGMNNKLGVDNDLDAINVWLSTITETTTWRSYRKEAERFLLWSLLERGKPISSMDTTDCIAYRDFLWDLGRLDPQSWHAVYKHPEQSWLGKRGTERWSASWRPFEQLVKPKPPAGLPKPEKKQWLKDHANDAPVRNGILSASSQKQAQVTLKAMCQFLTEKRYLDSNPWTGIPPRKKQVITIQVDRSFTKSQWKFLMDYLARLIEESADNERLIARYARLRFILIFAYGTGLRLTELCNASIRDLEFLEATETHNDAWVINVLGKGKRLRKVTMPSLVINELKLYLQRRGYESIESAPDDLPLIENTKPFLSPTLAIKDVPIGKEQKKLTETRLYAILKNFFAKAAVEMRKMNGGKVQQFASASTHWLRHTCGSHAAASGVSLEVIQKNFGHASIATTGIYVKPEIGKSITEMESFMSNAVT